MIFREGRRVLSELINNSELEIDPNLQRGRFSENGWGVFKSRAGISSPLIFEPDLVSVHQEQDEATEEVGRLNETEGYIEYEVHDDPETSIYSSVEFFAAEVALQSVGVKVELNVTYERVANSKGE